ncbi:hypothetical protein KL86DPRO_11498 [uncultured delta proteobacterium]|uniref:Uncharacterized protein n=1 Tax=uncultured delta proteobacterium TaxID=34034 RepID=A0A212JHV6_9DELT|nr:hypothetical protein KL86DPRO_11498 [uncultured delta proteobacterium]
MTMTGSATTSVVYEPDGLQTRFPVPFPVFDADDVYAVAVEDMTQTELANFTVEGLGTEEGAHVRFFTPPSFGPKLVLYRWTKRVQESDYPEGGRFPAKVVETDFDRLVAIAQEIDDQFAWTLKIPRGADMTPVEYTEALFLAADDARLAADEAGSSASISGGAARDARDMARDAASQARSAALMAESAAQSALDAANTVAQGMADATESTKGIVRLATAAEHESGASGLAATPAHVKALRDALREEIREDIREEVTAEAKKSVGVPLLSVIWSTTGLAKDNYLVASRDNGLLLRSEYGEAFADIQAAHDAGTGAVVEDAAWLAELAANNGVCGKYSLGDGATTFRMPLLGKRAS